jgi:hypothetical protein
MKWQSERGQHMAIEPQVAPEIARFLVGRPTPEQIVAFHPSQVANDRFYALIDAERAGAITDGERAELDSCINLEHIMRLIKAEAHLVMQQQAS